MFARFAILVLCYAFISCTALEPRVKFQNADISDDGRTLSVDIQYPFFNHHWTVALTTLNGIWSTCTYIKTLAPYTSASVLSQLTIVDDQFQYKEFTFVNQSACGVSEHADLRVHAQGTIVSPRADSTLQPFDIQHHEYPLAVAMKEFTLSLNTPVYRLSGLFAFATVTGCIPNLLRDGGFPLSQISLDDIETINLLNPGFGCPSRNGAVTYMRIIRDTPTLMAFSGLFSHATGRAYWENYPPSGADFRRIAVNLVRTSTLQSAWPSNTAEQPPWLRSIMWVAPYATRPDYTDMSSVGPCDTIAIDPQLYLLSSFRELATAATEPAVPLMPHSVPTNGDRTGYYLYQEPRTRLGTSTFTQIKQLHEGAMRPFLVQHVTMDLEHMASVCTDPRGVAVVTRRPQNTGYEVVLSLVSIAPAEQHSFVHMQKFVITAANAQARIPAFVVQTPQQTAYNTQFTTQQIQTEYCSRSTGRLVTISNITSVGCEPLAVLRSSIEGETQQGDGHYGFPSKNSITVSDPICLPTSMASCSSAYQCTQLVSAATECQPLHATQQTFAGTLELSYSFATCTRINASGLPDVDWLDDFCTFMPFSRHSSFIHISARPDFVILPETLAMSQLYARVMDASPSSTSRLAPIFDIEHKPEISILARGLEADSTARQHVVSIRDVDLCVSTTPLDSFDQSKCAFYGSLWHGYELVDKDCPGCIPTTSTPKESRTTIFNTHVYAALNATEQDLEMESDFMQSCISLHLMLHAFANKTDSLLRATADCRAMNGKSSRDATSRGAYEPAACLVNWLTNFLDTDTENHAMTPFKFGALEFKHNIIWSDWCTMWEWPGISAFDKELCKQQREWPDLVAPRTLRDALCEQVDTITSNLDKPGFTHNALARYVGCLLPLTEAGATTLQDELFGPGENFFTLTAERQYAWHAFCLGAIVTPMQTGSSSYHPSEAGMIVPLRWKDLFGIDPATVTTTLPLNPYHALHKDIQDMDPEPISPIYTNCMQACSSVYEFTRIPIDTGILLEQDDGCSAQCLRFGLQPTLAFRTNAQQYDACQKAALESSLTFSPFFAHLGEMGRLEACDTWFYGQAIRTSPWSSMKTDCVTRLTNTKAFTTSEVQQLCDKVFAPVLNNDISSPAATMIPTLSAFLLGMDTTHLNCAPTLTMEDLQSCIGVRADNHTAMAPACCNAQAYACAFWPTQTMPEEMVSRVLNIRREHCSEVTPPRFTSVYSIYPTRSALYAYSLALGYDKTIFGANSHADSLQFFALQQTMHRTIHGIAANQPVNATAWFASERIYAVSQVAATRNPLCGTAFRTVANYLRTNITEQVTLTTSDSIFTLLTQTCGSFSEFPISAQLVTAIQDEYCEDEQCMRVATWLGPQPNVIVVPPSPPPEPAITRWWNEASTMTYLYLRLQHAYDTGNSSEAAYSGCLQSVVSYLKRVDALSTSVGPYYGHASGVAFSSLARTSDACTSITTVSPSVMECVHACVETFVTSDPIRTLERYAMCEGYCFWQPVVIDFRGPSDLRLTQSCAEWNWDATAFIPTQMTSIISAQTWRNTFCRALDMTSFANDNTYESAYYYDALFDMMHYWILTSVASGAPRPISVADQCVSYFMDTLTSAKCPQTGILWSSSSCGACGHSCGCPTDHSGQNMCIYGTCETIYRVNRVSTDFVQTPSYATASMGQHAAMAHEAHELYLVNGNDDLHLYRYTWDADVKQLQLDLTPMELPTTVGKNVIDFTCDSRARLLAISHLRDGYPEISLLSRTETGLFRTNTLSINTRITPPTGSPVQSASFNEGLLKMSAGGTHLAHSLPWYSHGRVLVYPIRATSGLLDTPLELDPLTSIGLGVDVSVTKFGRSIDISEDGATLVVGAQLNGVGVAYVFVLDATLFLHVKSSWMVQFDHEQLCPESANRARFVQLSQDGQTLAIACGDNPVVALFNRQPGSSAANAWLVGYVTGWGQHGVLEGTLTPYITDFSMSPDGLVLTVVAYDETESSVAYYRYTRTYVNYWDFTSSVYLRSSTTAPRPIVLARGQATLAIPTTGVSTPAAPAALICGSDCGMFANAESICKRSRWTMGNCTNPQAQANCDGVSFNGCETNLYQSDNNCGACDFACPSDEYCHQGVCESKYSCQLHPCANPDARCESVEGISGYRNCICPVGWSGAECDVRACEPPEYVVSLDEPALTRWNLLGQAYGTQLRALTALFVNYTTHHPEIDYLLERTAVLTYSIPSEYAYEVAGLAQGASLDHHTLLKLQVFVDLLVTGNVQSAMTPDHKYIWTEVFSHDDNVHGDFYTALRPLAAKFNFTKSGQLLHGGSGFVGLVGIFSGTRPQSYSLAASTINALVNLGFSPRDIFASSSLGFTLTSLNVRTVLATAATSQQANGVIQELPWQMTADIYLHDIMNLVTTKYIQEEEPSHWVRFALSPQSLPGYLPSSFAVSTLELTGQQRHYLHTDSSNINCQQYRDAAYLFNMVRGSNSDMCHSLFRTTSHTQCNGSCVDTHSDAEHCGACGAKCNYAHNILSLDDIVNALPNSETITVGQSVIRGVFDVVVPLLEKAPLGPELMAIQRSVRGTCLYGQCGVALDLATLTTFFTRLLRAIDLSEFQILMSAQDVEDTNSHPMYLDLSSIPGAAVLASTTFLNITSFDANNTIGLTVYNSVASIVDYLLYSDVVFRIGEMISMHMSPPCLWCDNSDGMSVERLATKTFWQIHDHKIYLLVKEALIMAIRDFAPIQYSPGGCVEMYGPEFTECGLKCISLMDEQFCETCQGCSTNLQHSAPAIYQDVSHLPSFLTMQPLIGSFRSMFMYAVGKTAQLCVTGHCSSINIMPDIFENIEYYTKFLSAYYSPVVFYDCDVWANNARMDETLTLRIAFSNPEQSPELREFFYNFQASWHPDYLHVFMNEHGNLVVQFTFDLTPYQTSSKMAFVPLVRAIRNVIFGIPQSSNGAVDDMTKPRPVSDFTLKPKFVDGNSSWCEMSSHECLDGTSCTSLFTDKQMEASCGCSSPSCPWNLDLARVTGELTQSCSASSRCRGNSSCLTTINGIEYCNCARSEWGAACEFPVHQNECSYTIISGTSQRACSTRISEENTRQVAGFYLNDGRVKISPISFSLLINPQLSQDINIHIHLPSDISAHITWNWNGIPMDVTREIRSMSGLHIRARQLNNSTKLESTIAFSTSDLAQIDHSIPIREVVADIQDSENGYVLDIFRYQLLFTHSATNDTVSVCKRTCTSDMQCGSDGCGGVCGTCSEPLMCGEEGRCVYTPDMCSIIRTLDDFVITGPHYNASFNTFSDVAHVSVSAAWIGRSVGLEIPATWSLKCYAVPQNYPTAAASSPITLRAAAAEDDGHHSYSSLPGAYVIGQSSQSGTQVLLDTTIPTSILYYHQMAGIITACEVEIKCTSGTTQWLVVPLGELSFMCNPSCGNRQCGDDGCHGLCTGSGDCGSAGMCPEDGICCRTPGDVWQPYGHRCCTPQCEPGSCGPDSCGGYCNSCVSDIGYCASNVNNPTCKCIPGFTGDGTPSGVGCLPLPQQRYCNASNGGCIEPAECRSINDAPYVQCVCPSGFRYNYDSPYGCEEINECLNPSACPSGARCVNTAGSFYCACPSTGGVLLPPIEDQQCVQVACSPYSCDENCVCDQNVAGDRRWCNPDSGMCELTYCNNNGNIHKENGSCVCDYGFIPKVSDDATGEPLECVENRCLWSCVPPALHGTCTYVAGDTITCGCESGYVFSPDSRRCVKQPTCSEVCGTDPDIVCKFYERYPYTSCSCSDESTMHYESETRECVSNELNPCYNSRNGDLCNACGSNQQQCICIDGQANCSTSCPPHMIWSGMMCECESGLVKLPDETDGCTCPPDTVLVNNTCLYADDNNPCTVETTYGHVPVEDGAACQSCGPYSCQCMRGAPLCACPGQYQTWSELAQKCVCVENAAVDALSGDCKCNEAQSYFGDGIRCVDTQPCQGKDQESYCDRCGIFECRCLNSVDYCTCPQNAMTSRTAIFPYLTCTCIQHAHVINDSIHNGCECDPGSEQVGDLCKLQCGHLETEHFTNTCECVENASRNTTNNCNCNTDFYESNGQCLVVPENIPCTQYVDGHPVWSPSDTACAVTPSQANTGATCTCDGNGHPQFSCSDAHATYVAENMACECPVGLYQMNNGACTCVEHAQLDQSGACTCSLGYTSINGACVYVDDGNPCTTEFSGTPVPLVVGTACAPVSNTGVICTCDGNGAAQHTCSDSHATYNPANNECVCPTGLYVMNNNTGMCACAPHAEYNINNVCVCSSGFVLENGVCVATVDDGNPCTFDYGTLHQLSPYGTPCGTSANGIVCTCNGSGGRIFSCSDSRATYDSVNGICVCTAPYHISNNGVCIPPCPTCLEPSTCDTSIGQCACPSGFEYMAVSPYCIDINECRDPSVCPVGSTCTNLQGSFSCRCQATGKLLLSPIGTQQCETNMCSGTCNDSCVCDLASTGERMWCNPLGNGQCEPTGCRVNGVTHRNNESLCVCDDGTVHAPEFPYDPPSCVLDPCTSPTSNCVARALHGTCKVITITSTQCGCEDGYVISTDGKRCLKKKTCAEVCGTNPGVVCTPIQQYPLFSCGCADTLATYNSTNGTCTCPGLYQLSGGTCTCDLPNQVINGVCTLPCTDTCLGRECGTACGVPCGECSSTKQCLESSGQCVPLYVQGGEECNPACDVSTYHYCPAGATSCACMVEGFTPDGNDNCLDVNECAAQSNECKNTDPSLTCVNTVGSYYCACSQDANTLFHRSQLASYKACAPLTCGYNDSCGHLCSCGSGYQCNDAHECISVATCDGTDDCATVSACYSNPICTGIQPLISVYQGSVAPSNLRARVQGADFTVPGVASDLIGTIVIGIDSDKGFEQSLHIALPCSDPSNINYAAVGQSSRGDMAIRNCLLGIDPCKPASEFAGQYVHGGTTWYFAFEINPQTSCTPQFMTLSIGVNGDQTPILVKFPWMT